MIKTYFIKQKLAAYPEKEKAGEVVPFGNCSNRFSTQDKMSGTYFAVLNYFALDITNFSSWVQPKLNP